METTQEGAVTEQQEQQRRGRPRNSPARDERTAAEREQWAATVRQLRRALGDVTQAELARRLGVRPLAVSRWERAVVSPGPEVRAAIERMRMDANGQQS
jgi:ribosome-binding protein aMBF1 (putative translation factor)